MTNLTDPVLSARASFTEILAALPTPANASYRDTELGGIPTVEVVPDALDSDGVLLWIHGGAFIAGSARMTIAPAVHTAAAAGVRALSIDYRLAPEHPAPAAVEDALVAYRALLAQVPAGRIVLGGESAGGTLALELVLHARDAGLPLPRAVVVYSPVTDLSMSGESWRLRADVDPLPADVIRPSLDAYAGEIDRRDPSISPLFADLTGLPPLLVVVGSVEQLLDDSLGLARRAALADVHVEVVVGAHATHVFPSQAGASDEADAAIDAAGHFLRRALA